MWWTLSFFSFYFVLDFFIWKTSTLLTSSIKKKSKDRQERDQKNKFVQINKNWQILSQSYRFCNTNLIKKEGGQSISGKAYSFHVHNEIKCIYNCNLIYLEKSPIWWSFHKDRIECTTKDSTSGHLQCHDNTLKRPQDKQSTNTTWKNQWALQTPML